MDRTELLEKVSKHLMEKGPKPQVPKEELYEAILEIASGTEARQIVWLLKDAGWSEHDVKDFKSWFLQQGIKEGWLEAMVF